MAKLLVSSKHHVVQVKIIFRVKQFHSILRRDGKFAVKMIFLQQKITPRHLHTILIFAPPQNKVVWMEVRKD